MMKTRAIENNENECIPEATLFAYSRADLSDAEASCFGTHLDGFRPVVSGSNGSTIRKTTRCTRW